MTAQDVMQDCDVIKQAGYEVKVIRTARRKSATIKVEEGVVSVVVPKALPMEKIHQLLAAKHQWILEKLAIHADARPSRGKEYVSGEAFPYLGRNYRLKVVQGTVTPTKLVDGKITVTVPEYALQAHYVRRSLIHWYKRNADKKIREKVERYQSVVGIETAVVRIKDFKSRWGSCTPYGDLEFNWLVVLAPNRIVDYVVVHELCHLLHHDHSPQFWREVERVMPDYRECKEWLRDNAQLLVV